jgi:uncharacterized protein (DUF1697 family)
MYVSMLRAINLGAKNKVPMAKLVALYEEAGCTNVKTYIQSGNVIFDAPAKVAADLPEVISRRVKETFGFDVPVVQRTHAELVKVVKGNPFGDEPGILHVMFLGGDPKGVDGLDPNRSPPDAFEVKGQEIYLRCPEGFAHTKLTNTYFEKKLGVTCTVRNWKTLLKLVELSG